MTEHDLFKAIGYVDDDLISAADAPARKRRTAPVYWRGAISAAACLCLLIGGISVVKFRSTANNEAVMLTAEAPEAAAALDESTLVTAPDNAESSTALGLARCVRINGVNYYESAASVDTAVDRDADGVISDRVAEDELPEEDNCSNFGTGYAYWLLDDSRVLVEMDGEYRLFEAA